MKLKPIKPNQQKGIVQGLCFRCETNPATCLFYHKPVCSGCYFTLLKERRFERKLKGGNNKQC